MTGSEAPSESDGIVDATLTFGQRDPNARYEYRQAAYAVIFCGDLVAIIRNQRGRYFLPGGGAYPEETPEQTVTRELREELDCNVAALQPIGQAEQFFYADSDDAHYQMQAAFFVVEMAGVVGSASSDETLHWMSIDEARTQLFHACHVWAIETAIQEENHVLPIVEQATWEDRTLTVTWDDARTLPPRERTTQASGICFTDDGHIVLVGDGRGWSLPGGHPENGETTEEALVREVREEVCAVVESCVYLGAQRVDDPAQAESYYQTRWWARVTLLPFEPKYEITALKLIKPDDFVTEIGWETAQIAQAILQAARTVQTAQASNK